jgi:hypothetical protein
MRSLHAWRLLRSLGHEVLLGGLIELPRLRQPLFLLELAQRRFGRLAQNPIDRARVKAGRFQLSLRLLDLLMLHRWLARLMRRRLLARLASLPLLLHVRPRAARPRRRRGLLADGQDRPG